ncbi:MAG: DUF2723 domain-containing protein [bacterium]
MVDQKSRQVDSKSLNFIHIALGALVFIVSLVVYLMTVQRTLSLWDCGEFIACSYTMAVAHPPGTPLFLLIGRIFSILPTSSDIALRVNLLSALSSAVAALFGYLVTVRVLQYLPKVREDFARSVGAYLCAAVGALLFAFSRTNWGNSVEAEVYALAMLLTFLLVWYSLKWFDARGTALGKRYIILLAYLGVLAVGIHMTVFLVMVPIFLFIIISEPTLRRDLRFWVSGFLLLLVAMNVEWFLVGALAWLVISLVFYFSSRSAGWALAVWIMLAGIAGYSTHLYIPIRAAEKPNINENAPDTFSKFLDYVGRRQYGEESMLARMFNRRALLENQFGDFPRMGFGGFLWEQFGTPGVWFLIPLILAIVGIIGLIKWKWRVGVYLMVLLLMCTIGLVIYMNFADGSVEDQLTGNDKLEVRDRDYFFTPGFILFGLYIGIGIFLLLCQLLDRVDRKQALPLALLIGILSFVLPAAALEANYNRNDRSDNYLAYDYAYNLLMSCPENAILFTHGDNDTFPVWCLQEAYGIRTDVRVANLSLLQTDWYQLQLKHEHNVPISFDDAQMRWVEVDDPRMGRVRRPAQTYRDHLRGTEHYLVAFPDPETGELVSVAHQMIENIIAANKWQYPLVFANTMPTQVKYDLNKYNKRRGWVYQITREPLNGVFDIDTTLMLMDDVYRFRGLNDPDVYRGDVGEALVVGSMQNVMDFVDFLVTQGDTATADGMLDLIIEDMPTFFQAYATKAIIHKFNEVETDSFFQEFYTELDLVQKNNPDNIYFYLFRGMADQYQGRYDEALAAYRQAYEINPAMPIIYHTMIRILVGTGRQSEAIEISREFLKTNPHDQLARSYATGG